jgi:hypothetical protein
MYTLPQHPAPVTWRSRLLEACDEHDLLMVVRDFVARWTPLEIAALPPPCRPRKMVSGDDVTEFAYLIALKACEGDGDGGFLVRRMVSFFADASQRMSQIAGAAEAAEEPEARTQPRPRPN